MKKYLFLLLLGLISLNIQADEIDLHVGGVNPFPGGNTRPHAPVPIPTVYLDGYTLTFAATHAQYVLSLVKDGETEYSTIVNENEVQLVLPACLYGEFEIQLQAGSITFVGTVNF